MHESPQAGHATQATLTGDLLRTERGPFATIALCVTGLLPIVSVAEALGRLLLKWKRTATITYDGHAFVVVSETTLLGKPLRKDRWFVGTDVLLKREESYPQLALYTGLAALVLGTYVGLRLVWDGTRSASLSVLLLGLVIALLGLLLDYGLGILFAPSKPRFRIVIATAKRAVRIGGLNEKLADAFVASVTSTEKGRLPSERPRAVPEEPEPPPTEEAVPAHPESSSPP